MKKELKFKMSKVIHNIVEKPLRTKEEIILLLLKTMKMLEIDEYVSNVDNTNLQIIVDKMSRIFYISEDKIFSVQFPFVIKESHSENNRYEFYLKYNNIKIDLTLITFLIQIFEEMFNENITFERLFDKLYSYDFYNEELTLNQLLILIIDLLKFDIGYLRYDNDQLHCNGNMHPLYHLNFSLDNATTYMIGLFNGISFEDFKDIVDLTTEVWYISKNDR